MTNSTAVSNAQNDGASLIALILEAVAGIFGFLGVGHAYAGRKFLPYILMIAWGLWSLVESVVVIATGGLGLCLLPIHILVPVISGIMARTYAKNSNSGGHWLSVLLYGVVVVVVFITTLVLIFGGLIVYGSLNPSH